MFQVSRPLIAVLAYASSGVVRARQGSSQAHQSLCARVHLLCSQERFRGTAWSAAPFAYPVVLDRSSRSVPRRRSWPLWHPRRRGNKLRGGLRTPCLRRTRCRRFTSSLQASKDNWSQVQCRDQTERGRERPLLSAGALRRLGGRPRLQREGAEFGAGAEGGGDSQSWKAGDRREAFYPQLLGLMCAALTSVEPLSFCRGRVASSEASTGTTWPKASATSPRIGAANRIVGAETIPQNLFCECAGHLEASLRAARWC